MGRSFSSEDAIIDALSRHYMRVKGKLDVLDEIWLKVIIHIPIYLCLAILQLIFSF